VRSRLRQYGMHAPLPDRSVELCLQLYRTAIVFAASRLIAPRIDSRSGSLCYLRAGTLVCLGQVAWLMANEPCAVWVEAGQP